MKRILPLAMLAACGLDRPAVATLHGPGSATSHVIGAAIPVMAEWEGECSDIVEGRSKGHLWDTEPRLCDKHRFHVEVSCSSPCEPLGSRDNIGASSFVVVPRALGPMTISATMTSPGGDEIRARTWPTMQIVAPDHLEIECEGVPCMAAGVSAARPVIHPVVRVGEAEERMAFVIANGKRRELASDGLLSLADLFPEAREGDGVRPGIYDVEIAVGAVKGSWKVEARDAVVLTSARRGNEVIVDAAAILPEPTVTWPEVTLDGTSIPLYEDGEVDRPLRCRMTSESSPRTPHMRCTGSTVAGAHRLTVTFPGMTAHSIDVNAQD